jgi:superfamily I DNA and/or RNA helicase
MSDSLNAIDHYIKLKDYQIQYTPFEKIKLGFGNLVIEEEDYSIFKFTIDKFQIDNLKHSRGAQSLLINSEKFECEIIDLDKNHIAIRVYGYKGVDCKAEILTDMSFIFKKQKQVLEELKNNKYLILRDKLFRKNKKIIGGRQLECTYRNKGLNESQKKAISLAIGLNDFFLIWGPPGTGKTTIIPEIIMNYFDNYKKDGKKILICGWTNTAVDNVVQKLYKNEYNVVKYGKGVIRYGKRSLLDKEIFKEVLYDCQEKRYKARIEANYGFKINQLESSINEKLKKIKLFKTNNESLEKKITDSGDKNTPSIKELNKQINLNVKKFKALVKPIFETEISNHQKRLFENKNELIDVKVKNEKNLEFIEELVKKINEYEINNYNMLNQINELEQVKKDHQDALNITDEYLSFIKKNKILYSLYRAGFYSPSISNHLKKYGLHKKNYDSVFIIKRYIEQKIMSLESKSKDAIASKAINDDLKNKADELLNNKETIKQNLENRGKDLIITIDKDYIELNNYFINVALVEQFTPNNFIDIKNYFHISGIYKIRNQLLHLQNIIEENKNKINTIKNELTIEIKDNQNEIKTVNELIINLDTELKSIKNEIDFLEAEKAKKLDDITAFILKRYDVIATTVFETPKIFRMIDTDLTIIDEAGAIEVPNALIPIIQSRKVILLGDHKQIPPIIKEDKNKINELLSQQKELRQSIFELLFNKVNSDENCRIMLNMQYRMQKNIADFVGKLSYENQLETYKIIKSDLKNNFDKVINAEPQMIWFVREYWNEKIGTSYRCKLELDLIKNIVDNFKKAYGDEIINDIAVITPFREQYKLIVKELPKIECGTVHTFQGREKKIIIFSPAESKSFGPLFTGDKGKALLNVAVSRAQQKFIMIGNNKIYKNISHFYQLYIHIAKTGYIINDLLEEYDPKYCCPGCGKILLSPLYEFCIECGDIKKMQNRYFNEKKTFKCKDTHMVRSSGEVRIDDWLYDNGIEHTYEEKLPIQILLYCDWYLPKFDVYIEFWGSVHEKDKGSHRKYKEKIYKDHGLKLVNIEDNDLINLNDRLNHEFVKFKSHS